MWEALSAKAAEIRNRLLAAPTFQNWASTFPLTAGVSNLYAQKLFDIAVGFSYARILFACVELEIFARLQAGPRTAEALAPEIGLSAEAALTLLKAAAALDLLEPAGAGAFRLGRLGAALVGNPGVEAMIRHHSLLYDDLADPVALLRGKEARVAKFWAYDSTENAGASPAYSALMAATQAMIARQIIAAFPFARRRKLIDVGGGEGVFAAHAARAAPRLEIVVMDLPAVAARANARLAAEGLHPRVRAIGADGRSAPWPERADTISFVRVLHDHDDADVMRFLVAAHEVLPPGGQLLIAEPLAQTPGAHAMGHGYFGLYLLAMGQGRPRTRQELTAMARAAGFRSVAERRTGQPVLLRLLVAQKAGNFL